MNITLINPRIKTWNPNILVPLGLVYIGATLEHAGHSVQILDFNSHNISDGEYTKKVSASEIIGISGMITEYTEVLRLVHMAKECNSKAVIILGGALASTWTEKVLSSCEADFAVIGEGEKVVINLVSAIETSKDYRNIKGIAYNVGGKVIINHRELPIYNPDTILFPARHLLAMNRYTTHWFKRYGSDVSEIKSTTMITSRGCPYHCIFCFMNMWGHRWRGRSPGNIIREIKQLQNDYGYNGFVFYDDTFVLDKKRVMDFCQKIKESRLDIVWMCSGRINLMTEELINSMSQAGCRGISYGLESGNQKILDTISKGFTLEQVEKVTRLTEDAGIRVTGLFMLGMLGETRDTIRQTIEFARKLNLSFYCFALTVPLFGTQLYDLAIEKGLVIQNELADWSMYVNSNLTLDCTKEELEQIGKNTFREFNLEKTYGKHPLLNPSLWLDGIRSLLFLIGKRSNKELIKRVLRIAIK